MDVKTQIISSLEEIMDKMAFLYFEEPWEEDSGSQEYAFMTHVEFKGVIRGSLNLFFTSNSAEQIARNLLGIRDQDPLYEGTREDAVLEVTNMVMGRTMTCLDRRQGFELEIPRIISKPPPCGSNSRTLEIKGLLEGEPCRLLLCYRERGANE